MSSQSSYVYNLGVTAIPLCLDLYMCYGELNLSLHACMTGNLLLVVSLASQILYESVPFLLFLQAFLMELLTFLSMTSYPATLPRFMYFRDKVGI